MPGNHDDRENFRAAFASHAYLPAHGPLHYCVDEHPVRLVALDSCQPGKHHGHIDPAGSDWLRSTLQASPRKPTIVVMHHPPFVSGIRYLDDYRYIDAAPLEAVVGSFSNIEAVLCAHVPRPMTRRWAGTIVVSCPSTTTEIALQLNPEAEPRSYLAGRVHAASVGCGAGAGQSHELHRQVSGSLPVPLTTLTPGEPAA